MTAVYTYRFSETDKSGEPYFTTDSDAMDAANDFYFGNFGKSLPHQYTLVQMRYDSEQDCEDWEVLSTKVYDVDFEAYSEGGNEEHSRDYYSNLI